MVAGIASNAWAKYPSFSCFQIEAADSSFDRAIPSSLFLSIGEYFRVHAVPSTTISLRLINGISFCGLFLWPCMHMLGDNVFFVDVCKQLE